MDREIRQLGFISWVELFVHSANFSVQAQDYLGDQFGKTDWSPFFIALFPSLSNGMFGLISQVSKAMQNIGHLTECRIATQWRPTPIGWGLTESFRDIPDLPKFYQGEHSTSECGLLVSHGQRVEL